MQYWTILEFQEFQSSLLKFQESVMVKCLSTNLEKLEIEQFRK